MVTHFNIQQLVPLLTCVLFASLSYGQDTLRLGVPLLKPFTYIENNEFKGTAISPVKKALEGSKIKYKWVFIENYSLLLKAVRSEQIDGFFLATKNVERDKYARFSKPIFIDHYSWFILKDSPYELDSSDFKLNARIGAIIKTNSHGLTIRRGYQVYGQPAQLLAQQFINGTIDAVFATQSPFSYELDAIDFSKKKYTITQDSERPFGIYISKKYLGRHPDTLHKINQHITTQ
jgi:polar amino acid transport system substrate-binding protein